MLRRFTGRIWFIALLAVGVGSTAFVSAANAGRSNWLSSTEPSITKEQDLPENVEPPSTSIDCEMKAQPNGVAACAYKTPLGTMTPAYIFDGPNGVQRFNNTLSGDILPSVPNKPNLVLTETLPRNVVYGKTYRSGAYDASKLVYSTSLREYSYKGSLPRTLTHSTAAGGVESIAFAHSGVAYSTNGQWMVALVSGGGIMVTDTTHFNGRLIAWEAGAYKPGDTLGDTMTISDDGRFVALTLRVPAGSGTRPSLRVYDTMSCVDQYMNRSTATSNNACEFKDLWTGEYRTGNARGIRDVLPSAEYPRRVRFVADDTLTLDTVYDRTGPSAFKVARYAVHMPESNTREYVGVLGLGDSYISGEGATGTYWTGTNTKNNKCHLSRLSHPYLLGAVQFPYGRSVACSGAKMFDVSMAAGDPKGEVQGEEGYVGQLKSKTGLVWSDRNTETILATLSPGYAQQFIFARTYKPRTTLLTISGNDIAFRDIIIGCVGPHNPGTCYQYYEDRLALMNQILGQYDRMVATYKDVLQQSGGRLYVTGYPQVAAEGGSCGTNVHLDAEEVKFSARLITYLNGVIARAAAEAGAYYVDTGLALKNYRLCEAPKNQAAMNGLTAGDDTMISGYVYIMGTLKHVKLGIGNESYHPTAFGHKLLAQTIMSKTNNLTAAMPSARPNNKPALNLNDTFLQAPHAPEQQRHTEAIQWQQTDDVLPLLQKGQKTKLNVGEGQLQAGTRTQVIMHSDPVVLYDGPYTTDAMLSVPLTIEPGFHTLDIYSRNEAGEPVDYRQAVYVMGDENDYDEDGVANTADSCPMVSQSGLDEDDDGVDDACDGVIGSLAADDTSPNLPPTEPLSFDEGTDTVSLDAVYANSLLRPFALPAPSPEPAPSTKPDPETPKESSAIMTQGNGLAQARHASDITQLLQGVSTSFFAPKLSQPSADVPFDGYDASLAGPAVLSANTQGGAVKEGSIKLAALASSHKDPAKRGLRGGAVLWWVAFAAALGSATYVFRRRRG